MNSAFRGLGVRVVVGAIALCAIAINGCSDGGSSGPPVGEDAAETGAAMSQQALVGVEQILSFDVVDPTGVAELTSDEEGLAGASRLGLFNRLGLHQRLSILTAQAGGTAEATEMCTSGGSVTEDCVSTETDSTYSISANNCQESFDEFSFTANGGLQITAADPGACDTGLEESGDFQTTFNNFSFTLRLDGQVFARIEADGDISVTGDTAVGCEATGGSLVGNYSIEVFSADESVDVRVTATELSIVVAPGVNPCESTTTINGELYVVDRVAGEQLRQTFQDLVVTLVEGDTSTLVSIDGVSGLNCMGNVQFETVEALDIPDDSDCPVAGVLRVTIVDSGDVALVTFNADGSVSIDLGEDGTIDRTRPSCGDLRAACKA